MDSAGAEGPDTLPPMPQGKEAGGEGAGAEGPDTPSRPPNGPAPRPAGSAGAEGPDTQPEGGDAGAKGPEMFSPLSQGAVPREPGDTGAEGPEMSPGSGLTGSAPGGAGPLDAQVPRALKCDSGPHGIRGGSPTTSSSVGIGT